MAAFTLLERNVLINCVGGGASGYWNEFWSNTVMMQESFTLKRILNYSFKGKRNVGRRKNDLQLKSGDKVTPSLACCEEEVQKFALDKYGCSRRVTEGWAINTRVSFSCLLFAGY